MKISLKDGQILQHIVEHCEEVNAAIKIFGKSKTHFKNNPVYCNAVSMPLLQIGELAKHLSTDFIKESTSIPWKQIKGMRDMFAHTYHSMDKEKIWATAIDDIPQLQKNCQKILKTNRLDIPNMKEIKYMDNTR